MCVFKVFLASPENLWRRGEDELWRLGRLHESCCARGKEYPIANIIW